MDIEIEVENEAFLGEMADKTDAAEVPEPDQQLIAGYTEDEIKGKMAAIDKLQKSIDTTNGTFGNRFAELDNSISEFNAKLSDIESGTGLDPEAIAQLHEEYPELAEILDHPESEPEPVGEPDTPQELHDPRLDAYIDEQNSKELIELKRQHEDWQEVAMFSRDDNGLILWNDDGFGRFVSELPEDERNTLLNVWDARFVGQKISDYKATLQDTQKQKPSLEDAVRPRGLPGQQSPDPTDLEEAAFRKEMASP